MTLTRRAILTAAPAAMAFPAVAQPEDPILPVYREWCAARNEWKRLSHMPGNGNWDLPEALAAEARWFAAQAQIADMVPTSLPGIAAQAHVLWSIIGPESLEGTASYAEELELEEVKLINGIRQAAGEPWPCQD